MPWKLVNHNSISNFEHHILTTSEELIKDDYYITNHDTKIKRYNGKNVIFDDDITYKVIAISEAFALSNKIVNLPIIKSAFGKEVYNAIITNDKYSVYLNVDENDVVILNDKYANYKIV